jgi:uncharacterized protein YbjT (DUF2867 family)
MLPVPTFYAMGLRPYPALVMQAITGALMKHYPLVTIVGGSGFVGRHVVKLLAAEGYRIRVLTRDTYAADFLKTTATVGSIASEYADITRPQTLLGKFNGSDVVINLVSIRHESGRQKFKAINVDGAAAIAAEAKRAGVKTLIQISALGIEAARTTKYASTKLAGEEAVRANFPGAIFLRPSLIIGPEDNFFQRFARMALLLPALPLIGGGRTKFQPILVTDVAHAILAAIRIPEARGNMYELAGPQVYSFRALLELMASITKRKLRLVSIPSGIAKLKGLIFELLPFAPLITRDQVKLLAYDNVSNGALTAADLGIAPAAIDSALPQYLARFVKA